MISKTATNHFNNNKTGTRLAITKALFVKDSPPRERCICVFSISLKITFKNYEIKLFFKMQRGKRSGVPNGDQVRRAESSGAGSGMLFIPFAFPSLLSHKCAVLIHLLCSFSHVRRVHRDPVYNQWDLNRP